jgi:hypothetical protein
MDTKELRKWAEKHSIESRTIKSYWEVFDSYKELEKEEFLEVFGENFDKSKLRVNLGRVGLFIDAWNVDADIRGFDYVISYIPILYEDEVIGEYRKGFKLDGECYDDWFIIF